MDDNVNILSDIDPDINHSVERVVDFQKYSIDSFVRTFEILDNALSLFHHNSRSILKEGRIDEYDYFFKAISYPFHVLTFTETWLTKNNSKYCNFEGYEPIHLLRPIDNNFDFKTKGGGVSIFVKEGIYYKERKDLNLITNFAECLFVEIVVNRRRYLICGIYRIPNTNIDIFCETINSILEPINKSHEIILMGDFNVCLLQNNRNSNNLINTMQSNNMYPTIFLPTRVSIVQKSDNEIVTTEALIDNIFVDTQKKHRTGLFEISISDHYPVFIMMPGKSDIHKSENKSINYRLVNDLTISNFVLSLNSSSELGDLYSIQSADIAFGNFISLFDRIYNKHFPIKSVKLTRKGELKPWVNLTLISRMKIRDRLAKLANKNIIDRKTFTDFRNSLTKQLRDAKAQYFEDKFKETNGNTKGTWNIINKAIKPNKKTINNISIVENDISIDKSQIPNKFIEYFTTKVDKLTSQLPKIDRNPSSFLKNRVPNSFFMTPINEQEVANSINSIKDNGNKINIISSNVLKESKLCLSKFLSHIFNLCISQGYFPNELKTGCITPIFKDGVKTDIGNYRPVCSLSLFSKVFERVIYERMIDFIIKNNILSENQYGFRQGMSTETALTSFVDEIQKGLINRQFTISVFMDLTKAFDVVDHSILESKLEHYGFRGIPLQLLMSFIRERKYFVSVNNIISDTRTVNRGVPQGSTLGPLLFLIYINDICNCSDILKFLLFADDTTVTYSGKDLETIIKTIESELTKIFDWLLCNKLIINLNKTHFMLFTNKRGYYDMQIKVHDNILV